MLRPHSHRTRRCSQMLQAKNGTYCCLLECSHSIAGKIKGFACKFACKPAYASCVNWALGKKGGNVLRCGADILSVGFRPPVPVPFPVWRKFTQKEKRERIKFYHLESQKVKRFFFGGGAFQWSQARLFFKRKGRTLNIRDLPHLDLQLNLPDSPCLQNTQPVSHLWQPEDGASVLRDLPAPQSWQVFHLTAQHNDVNK